MESLLDQSECLLKRMQWIHQQRLHENRNDPILHYLDTMIEDMQRIIGDIVARTRHTAYDDNWGNGANSTTR